VSAETEQLLRAGLLDGVTVALAAGAEEGAGSVAGRVRSLATGLGARVEEIPIRAGQSAEAEEAAVEELVGAALARAGSLQALVLDGASLFGEPDGRDALIACLASAWNASRATARLALLGGHGGGRIVLIAPRAGREHAAAAAAGLENLARTLSIEWARHGVTTVALAPAAETSEEDLATLACYLLSPAGAYFSGCLMDLRGGL